MDSLIPVTLGSLTEAIENKMKHQTTPWVYWLLQIISLKTNVCIVEQFFTVDSLAAMWNHEIRCQMNIDILIVDLFDNCSLSYLTIAAVYHDN